MLVKKPLNEIASLLDTRNSENILEKSSIVSDSLTVAKAKMLYSCAFHSYQAGQYGKAEDIFRYLTFKDPQTSKYWLGLGACLQMVKAYEAALSVYQMAAGLDPQNSSAHLYAAECLISLKSYQKAEYALEHVRKLHKKFSDSATGKARLKALTLALDKCRQNEDNKPLE